MRDIRISQKDTLNPNTTRVLEVLHSEGGKLLRIMLLEFSAAFLTLFLVVFGVYRRRSNNETFQLILGTTYSVPLSLANYAIGLMIVTPPNIIIAFWLIFLMILVLRADSFSALSLQDHGQWRRYNRELLLMVTTALALFAVEYGAFVNLLYLAVIMKAFGLAQASVMAEAVIQKNAKLVADYMMREDLKNSQDEVDLNTMKGFTYLVSGEEEAARGHRTLVQRLFSKPCFQRMKVVKAEAPKYDVPLKLGPQVITVDRVWQCQGKLLGARDSDHRIKDFCLSFALFQMLSSKIAGYSMVQGVYHKSWELFQTIILFNEDGYERALRIIEVELTFVFYQFYTRYPFIFRPVQWMLKIGELVLLCFGSSIIALAIWNIIREDNGVDIITLPTIIIVIVVPILEISQLLFMIFSKWGKVILICNYVKRESWQKNKCIEKLVEFICHIELLQPWKRKLHQYSFLESYGYSPSLLLHNNLTATVINQKKKGRKQSTSIKLSTEVKHVVISSLLVGVTKLENGKNSLRRNNVIKYDWACDLETQAQVIMVWHIATSMCEYKNPVSIESQPHTLKKFKIATSLSKYLAYLVAFAPRLLPDHPYVTEYVLDQVIIEASETFDKYTTLEDKITKLKDECSGERSETVINRGARLGKQLLDDEEPTAVWNVLADFWAELMLYVAPSDDMDAHVEKLTTGGEFITHIWALLSHSGFERDLPSKTSTLERSQSCPDAQKASLESVSGLAT